MNKDEALRLALEALENSWTEPNNEQYEIEKNAITAIKAALETKDEPVAWEQFHEHMAGPNYVAPQSTWVGLTNEEIAEVEDEYIVDYRIPAGSAWNFAKDIEAKLKEKNT